MTTYYDILQVSPYADPSVIESAYHSLVAKYEPQAATSYEASQQLRGIHEAYQVLSDPARRAQYDRELRGESAPAPVTPEFAYAPTQPAPATAPLPPPAKRSGAPMWVLGILGLCILIAIGLVCLGAFVTIGGGGLAGLLLPATPTLVTATSVVELPPLAPTSVPPVATLSIATVPPGTNGSDSIVTAAVTAQDAQGDNFTPVGVTDSFPADQNVFHTIVTVDNAPADTAVQVIWLTSAGSSIGQFELRPQGSRNLDFTFKPNNGALPAGQYQVQIFLDGNLNRTLTFSVGRSGGSTLPNFIANVTMAQDTQGDNKDPVNPTTVFASDSIFHAVVATKDAPANTKFAATWFAVDVGSAAAPNTKIDSSELTTDGTRNLDFTLKPKTTWPKGTYRVEIYVNDQLAQTVSFSVQ